MAATYEPIATTTLSSAASSIIFNSIANTYTDLRIVITGTSSTDYALVRFRLNGDTGSNYSFTRLYGTGSSATSDRSTSQTVGSLDAYNGMMTATPTMATLDIFNYAGSTNKTTLGTGAQDLNGSGTVSTTVSLWRDTSAVTSVTLLLSSGNFASGTTATLYGILKA